MKRRKKNTSRRFKITAYQPSSRKALADLEPEEFASLCSSRRKESSSDHQGNETWSWICIGTSLHNMPSCLPPVIRDSLKKVCYRSQIKFYQFGKMATTHQVQITRLPLRRLSKSSMKGERQRKTTPTLFRHSLRLEKTFHVASGRYQEESSNTLRRTCGKSG